MGPATREMVGIALNVQKWVVWGGLDKPFRPSPWPIKVHTFLENLLGNSCPLLKDLLSFTEHSIHTDPMNLLGEISPGEWCQIFHLGGFMLTYYITIHHVYIYIYIYESIYVIICLYIYTYIHRLYQIIITCIYYIRFYCIILYYILLYYIIV